MKKTLTTFYGILAFLATGLATVLALVFVVAIVLGGEAGRTLSELGGAIGEWSIYIASAAVLLGLVHVYVTGTHSLTAGTKRSAPDTEAPHTPAPDNTP